MCLDVEDKELSFSNGSGAPASRRLRVAVAGLGVIGEGAALELAKEDIPYALCAALVRDPAKTRAVSLKTLRTYSDPAVMLVEHPDVVVDALPSGEAGRRLIEAALAQGVSIVTANKQAIAGALALLHKHAEQNHAVLAYSPSVGGGAPMVETVQRAREQGDPREIAAILNGTVNFILSAMKNGAAFGEAVKRAQDAGFAEPDPTADLSGEDARAKISILTYEAFGHEIDLDAIQVEPLTAERANSFVKGGGVWKQLAQISRRPDGEIAARVTFARVDDDPFFRKVEKEGNALRVANADGRAFTCEGKGAGRAPTVGSIFSDLEKIARLKPSRNIERPENSLRRSGFFN
ncbi:homoserine dehydrogenase [Hyphococcus sp.]|uniref:homoserine dehydrogenase n=1 Tax=Hyphococcus sp. TaxID=2038636 RepID=UPI003CCBC770